VRTHENNRNNSKAEQVKPRSRDANKAYLKRKKNLLAIDADPDSNLPDVLGVKVDKTIGDMREFMLQERDKLPLIQQGEPA